MPKGFCCRTGKLLDVLRDLFPEWRTATLRQRLKAGLVLVAGVVERSGAKTTEQGVSVEILAKPAGADTFFPARMGPPPLKILYRDRDLLAVDKPSGLLSVATARERNLTAIHVMREWLAGLDPAEGARLHAAHRLDRETSGVLLLARSAEIRKTLVAHWRLFEKTYLALTDGIPAQPEGVVDVPLQEDKGLFVRVAEPGRGEAALTRYRTLRTAGGRALVEVALGSGRKHQIRVHLAHIGCPVVGDLRYGRSKAKRLALHASSLGLIHPADGRTLTIRAETPPFFRNRLKSDS